MKKMFFGSMLFISGFISVFTLVVLSVFKPWSYNDIEGFYGFLLGTDTEIWFVFSCVLMVCGLVVCVQDMYQKLDIKNK